MRRTAPIATTNAESHKTGECTPACGLRAHAHALGHDLLDLSYIRVLRGELAEARVSLQEALVWFGFTEDADALASTRAQLAEFDANGGVQLLANALRQGVKSHLPLSQGKVYCEFGSPVRRNARG